LKIFKNGNDYSFYYWNVGAWTQLGATQTNAYTGNPYIHYFGNSQYNRSIAYIDNTSVADTNFTTQIAVSSSNNFIYLSSAMNESILLSKTDADFTYKLPDIPRLATKAYNVGELVKYDFAGISKTLSGLTE